MQPTYEIVIIYEPTKEGGKPHFENAGGLWPAKNGDGFSGTMRMAGNTVRVLVRPPRSKEERETAAKPVAKSAANFDDDLPF